MSEESTPAGLGEGRFARRVIRAIVVALAFVGLATLAGRFGQYAWPFELMSHFAVQLLAVQVLGMAVLLAYGRRRLAAAFLPFALINLLLIAPYLLSPLWRAEAAGGSTQLTLMAANIHHSRHRADLLQAEIRRIDPDVILLVEPIPTHYGEGSLLRRSHPHVIFHRDGAGTGIMLASRIPWERATTLTLNSSYSPSIYATFCPAPDRGPAGCVDILGIHPISPLSVARSRMRDAELHAVAEFVGERQPQRFIVLGDFNTTPWSVRFLELIDRTGLSESPVGRGLTATWMSRNPLFGLPIDHLLVGRDIHVVHQEVGRDIGSDHYPIAATVVF